MITSLHINTKEKGMASPALPHEVHSLSIVGQFVTTRGHLQRLTQAASRAKMKRSEFIRHLLNTHPEIQELS